MRLPACVGLIPAELNGPRRALVRAGTGERLTGEDGDGRTPDCWPKDGSGITPPFDAIG